MNANRKVEMPNGMQTAMVVCVVGLSLFLGSKFITRKPAGASELYDAVRTNATERAVYMIERHPELMTHRYSSMILNDALSRGNERVVRAMVAAGYDLNRFEVHHGGSNFGGLDGETWYSHLILSQAASWQDYEMIALLVELGADPNNYLRGNSPLARACRFPMPGTFREYHFEKRMSEAELNVARERWETGKTSLKIVRMLLEAGADPNAAQFQLPIVRAVWDGRADLVKLLLEFGADPNLPRSQSLLDYCDRYLNVKSYYNHPSFRSTRLPDGIQMAPDYQRIRDLLVQYGAVRPNFADYNRMRDAWMSDDHTSLLALLDAEPELATLEVLGKPNLIQLATSKGQIDLLKQLVERGIDITQPDLDGDTALRNACYLDDVENLEVVQFLIEQGIDVNAHSGHSSPLAVAVRYQDCELIELLLRHGADPDNALGIACQSAKFSRWSGLRDVPADLEIVKMLLNAGAKTRQTGGGRQTLLTQAVRSGNQELVKLLAKHDPSLVDSGLYKAVELAHGFVEMSVKKDDGLRENGLQMIRILAPLTDTAAKYDRYVKDNKIRRALGLARLPPAQKAR